MFEQSGEKIKLYALAYFIVEVLILIISGIVCLANGSIFGAIIVLVLGFLSVYVGCLCISAFGDLVENSKENLNTNRQILKVLEELNEKQKTPVNGNPVTGADGKQAGSSPAAADPEVFQVDPNADMIVCPKCKMAQRADRIRCYNCGAAFESSEQSQ